MIMTPNAETSLDRRVLSRVKKGPFSWVRELKYIILKVQIRLKKAKNKKLFQFEIFFMLLVDWI